MRAAKAAAVSEYLSADLDSKWTVSGDNAVAWYDAGKGTLVNAAPTAKYGKGTTADGGTEFEGYDKSLAYTDKAIEVTVNTKTGAVSLAWK